MSQLGLNKSALDDLPVEQVREVLRDLARAGDATLGMIGAQPEAGAVFVVDTFSEVGAGTEVEALKAYARTNGLEFIGPTEHRDTPGSDLSWVVHLGTGDSQPSVMFSADSYDDALGQMLASMRDLAGDRVQALHDWAQVESAESLIDMLLAPPKVAAVKLTPFVTWERIQLAPLPLAPLLAKERADTSKRKIRRKMAYEMLVAPQGMGNQHTSPTKLSDWNIPVLVDGDKNLSNHHDIIAALRLGLDIADIKPWPGDVAHRFLVHEELRSAMRSRGYAELTDFDEKKFVHLRVSLPEYTPSITGDELKPREKITQQEKPSWPPQSHEKQRVVIVLGRARLAYEDEPEWERVGARDIIQCGGYLWVEIQGTFEKQKKTGSKKAKNK
jgi:hypothetical protein